MCSRTTSCFRSSPEYVKPSLRGVPIAVANCVAWRSTARSQRPRDRPPAAPGRLHGWPADSLPGRDARVGLRAGSVDVVDVQGVVVHREQGEEVVVRLGHGLRRPVLVDGADLELLEVAAVAVGAGRLALGLVGGQLVLMLVHRSI